MCVYVQVCVRGHLSVTSISSINWKWHRRALPCRTGEDPSLTRVSASLMTSLHTADTTVMSCLSLSDITTPLSGKVFQLEEILHQLQLDLLKVNLIRWWHTGEGWHQHWPVCACARNVFRSSRTKQRCSSRCWASVRITSVCRRRVEVLLSRSDASPPGCCTGECYRDNTNPHGCCRADHQPGRTVTQNPKWWSESVWKRK